MAVVDLTGLPIARAVPMPFLLGGTVRGPLGGAAQRIDRLGSRWAFAVETPDMPIEPDGRVWGALLDDALRNGALLPIAQPDFVVGVPGAPVVGATTVSGRAVPVTGLTAGYTVRKGQWLSLVVAGQRFADRAAVAATASGGGAATLTLTNLLRKPVPAGTVVELAVPKIEGSIDGDFGGAWELDRFTSFAFTITEDQ